MFQIHYCEFSRKNDDHDVIFRPYGSGDWLFLLFLAPMSVSFETETAVAPAGSCLLYSPGAYQKYRGVEVFRNSYVHFSAPEEEIRRYGIPWNRILYPASPDALNRQIRVMQEEYLNRGQHWKEMGDLLLRRLLISTARSLEQGAGDPDSLLSQFQKARLAILSQCEEEWDIYRMCGLVNMGKSQFYRYYRQFFQASPRDELLAARMDRARNLLTNEAMQVQQAAALCGFKSICHFTRYFRQICGCTPGEYQRQVSRREK